MAPTETAETKAESFALPTQRGTPRSLEPRLDPESRRDMAVWRRRITRSTKPLCVSLWSGAGGLDLGLSQAGFDVVVGADSDEWACRTHGHNSDALVFQRDLSDPDNTRAWLRELDLPEVALLAGGFPCQPYSRAGHSIIRHLVATGQRPAEDPRSLAWLSFVAAVDELRPSHVIAENVPDLARYNDGQLLRDILESLEELGYRVDIRILPTKLFGVPQHRERLIIQAACTDLEIVWPEPRDCDPTLDFAIGDLPRVEAGSRADPIAYVPHEGRSAPVWAEVPDDIDGFELHDHICRDVRADDLEAYRVLPPGGTYLDVPKALRRYDDEAFTDKYKRLEWDKPSRTITAHIARDGYWYIHPEQHRTLSIREAARIQTFPDWFVFAGFPSNRLTQIGNAVPPLLGKALGSALLASRTGSGKGSPVPSAANTLNDWALARPDPPDPWVTLLNEAILGGRAGGRRLSELVSKFPTIEDAANSAGEPGSQELKVAALARALVGTFAGRVPSTAEDLRELPAVTGGTGDLLVSILLGEGLPQTAGTHRVAQRVSGTPREGTLNGLHQVVLARLTWFGSDPRVNRALVEISRLFCLPEDPVCEECPLSMSCASSQADSASAAA